MVGLARARVSSDPQVTLETLEESQLTAVAHPGRLLAYPSQQNTVRSERMGRAGAVAPRRLGSDQTVAFGPEQSLATRAHLGLTATYGGLHAGGGVAVAAAHSGATGAALPPTCHQVPPLVACVPGQQAGGQQPPQQPWRAALAHGGSGRARPPPAKNSLSVASSMQSLDSLVVD